MLLREQLYGRHRARTKRKERRAPRFATLRAPEGIHTGREGVFETLTQGKGGVY